MMALLAVATETPPAPPLPGPPSLGPPPKEKRARGHSRARDCVGLGGPVEDEEVGRDGVGGGLGSGEIFIEGEGRL